MQFDDAQDLQAGKVDMALLAIIGLGNDYFPALSYKSFNYLWRRYTYMRSSSPHR